MGNPDVLQVKVQSADAKCEGHERGGDVIEAFLKLVELSFFDKEKRQYLLPRGLKSGRPPGTEDWPTARLRWEFVPESAFHHFVVRMHHRQQVVSMGGGYAHGRDWVMVRHDGCRAVVSADSVNGVVEIRFDPKSPSKDHPRAFDLVRDLFAHEFIGKPPTQEGRVPQEITNEQVERKPRSITKDDMRVKVIATLMTHHFPNGSDFVGEPIVLSALARSVGTNPGRVSEFFRDEFQGHASYVRMCTWQPDMLCAKLKALNDECIP